MFGKRKTPNARERVEAQYQDAGPLPAGTVSKPVTSPPPRASSEPPRQPQGAAAQPPSRPVDPAQAQPRRSEARAPVETAAHEGRKLVVGRDISLSGEIKSCEKLVVEGQVEAHLNECRFLQISPSGIYKGAACVEQAEISGLFEGDLIVQERLILRTSGQILGRLHYAEMEIERGGRIVGEIAQLEIQPESAPAPRPEPEAKPEPQQPRRAPAKIAVRKPTAKRRRVAPPDTSKKAK